MSPELPTARGPRAPARRRWLTALALLATGLWAAWTVKANVNWHGAMPGMGSPGASMPGMSAPVTPPPRP